LTTICRLAMRRGSQIPLASLARYIPICWANCADARTYLSLSFCAVRLTLGLQLMEYLCSRMMMPASTRQKKANSGTANIDMGKLNGPSEEAITSPVAMSATGSQVIPQASRMYRRGRTESSTKSGLAPMRPLQPHIAPQPMVYYHQIQPLSNPRGGGILHGQARPVDGAPVAGQWQTMLPPPAGGGKGGIAAG